MNHCMHPICSCIENCSNCPGEKAPKNLTKEEEDERWKRVGVRLRSFGRGQEKDQSITKGIFEVQ